MRSAAPGMRPRNNWGWRLLAVVAAATAQAVLVAAGAPSVAMPRVDVDASAGSDTPTCGVAPRSPCATIAAAFARVPDVLGDDDDIEVVIGPGVYREQAALYMPWAPGTLVVRARDPPVPLATAAAAATAVGGGTGCGGAQRSNSCAPTVVADAAGHLGWIAGGVANVVVSGLEFRNAWAPPGGSNDGAALAFQDCAHVSIADSVFRNNTGGSGGALAVIMLYVFGPQTATIERCAFLDNVAYKQGGGATILAATDGGHFTGLVADVLLDGNTAGTEGGGLVLSSPQTGEQPPTVALAVSNVTATNNAAGGAGGGLFVRVSLGRETLPDGDTQWCNGADGEPPPERRWETNATVAIERYAASGNRASLGGGVCVTGGATTFGGCVLSDNSAIEGGGGVAVLQQGSSAELRDCVVAHNTARVGGAQVHGVGASVRIGRGTTLTAAAEPATGGGNAAVDDEDTNAAAGLLVHVSQSSAAPLPAQPSGGGPLLTCAAGSSIQVELDMYLSLQPVPAWGYTDCGAATHTLRVTCVPCPPGQYTLQSGAANASTVVGHAPCLPCPWGAECSLGGARARVVPGHWGVVVVADSVSESEATPAAPQLQFLRCPSNTCCQASAGAGVCDRDDASSCAPHRHGTLCGSCVEGNSATIGSAACTPDASCGGTRAAVLIGAIAVAGAAFAAYALQSGKNLAKVSRHARRSGGALKTGRGRAPVYAWVERLRLPDGATAAALYFAQNARIIAGSALDGGGAASRVADVVFGVAGMSPPVAPSSSAGSDAATFDIAAGLCPWSGFDDLGLIAIGLSVPAAAALFLASATTYALACGRRVGGHHCCSRGRGGGTSGGRRERWRARTVGERSEGALELGSHLLTSGDNAGVGVDTGSDARDNASSGSAANVMISTADHNATFIRHVGAWAKLLMVAAGKLLHTCLAFVTCVAIPGTGVSAVATAGATPCSGQWWQVAAVCVAVLLVALPVLLVRHQMMTRGGGGSSSGDAAYGSSAGAGDVSLASAASHMVSKPFRADVPWWWAVLLAHRLLVAVIGALVPSAATAAVLQVVLSASALAAHVASRPYTSRGANALQTLLSLSLVLLAAFVCVTSGVALPAVRVDNSAGSAFLAWQNAQVVTALVAGVIPVAVVIAVGAVHAGAAGVAKRLGKRCS